MGQQEKLLERFLAKPKDFTWDEFKRLMSGQGYQEAATGKTGGSRRRFVHEKYGPVVLHKPHPGNELKGYQVSQVITFVKVNGIVGVGTGEKT